MLAPTPAHLFQTKPLPLSFRVSVTLLVNNNHRLSAFSLSLSIRSFPPFPSFINLSRMFCPSSMVSVDSQMPFKVSFPPHQPPLSPPVGEREEQNGAAFSCCVPLGKWVSFGGFSVPAVWRLLSGAQAVASLLSASTAPLSVIFSHCLRLVYIKGKRFLPLSGALIPAENLLLVDFVFDLYDSTGTLGDEMYFQDSFWTRATDMKNIFWSIEKKFKSCIILRQR